MTLLLACLPALLAATFHLDATGGDDAADGLTPESAWKTLARVYDTALEPGDAVLLRRGERWREGLVLSSSGAEGRPITIGAYGEGDRPVIDASRDLEGEWVDLGAGLYSLAWTVEPSVLLFEGEPRPPIFTVHFEALRVPPEVGGVLLQLNPWSTLWVTSTSAGDGTVSGITFFGDQWDTVTEVLDLSGQMVTDPDGAAPVALRPVLHALTETGHWYWHQGRLVLKADAPPEGLDLAVGAQAYCINSNQQDHLVIEGLELVGGDSGGLVLTGTDHAVVRDNHVHGIGSAGFRAGIAVVGSSHNEVSGNHLQHCLTSGIAVSGWGETLARYNRVEDNHISDVGGAGVVMGVGGEGLSDNLVVGNTILRPGGLSYDVAGIYVYEAGPGNRIHRNTILDGGSEQLKCAGVMADLDTGPLHLAYNLIHGNSNGGIGLSGSGHQVLNNTLHHNRRDPWVAGEITLFPVTADVSECVAVNNLLVADEGGSLVSALSYGGYDGTGGHDFQHNLYFGGSEEPFTWGTETLDWTGWQAVSGLDATSILADPLLDSPPADFSLAAGSPAIDAGVEVGLAEDLLGATVPQGEGVDLGALESSPAADTGAPDSGSPADSTVEDDAPSSPGTDSGCGCAATSIPAGPAWLVAFLLGLRARRPGPPGAGPVGS